jgi:integrase
MRLLMNVTKDRHGTYYAIKKVPEHLQEAVARVLNRGKARQTWLKRSLRTKDVEQANRIAKPVLIEFDRILAQAEALQAEWPLRSELSAREIEQIANYFYAHELAADEDERREGGSEKLFQAALKQLDEAGVEYDTPYAKGPVPAYGLSDRDMAKIDQTIGIVLPAAQQALARGNIGFLKWEIDELLTLFRINLDPKCLSYRELGMAVLKAFVRALKDTARRQKGEPIETPPLPAVNSAPLVTPGSTTLPAAFEGWKRANNRSPRTAQEYEYAVKLFGELHGDMPLAAVRKSHARQFREALQAVPIRSFRTGKLQTATLPELATWGRDHTNAKKISAGTINKLLGALQSVGRWARKEDLVPEEWTDPFADMRVEGDESERAPFEIKELQAIFGAPVFTEGHRPEGGKGEASFWLPLLALFTGARLGELAGLRASDVVHDASVGTVCIYITADAKAGRRLKTKQSARAIPIHAQLIELGFLKFVAAKAKAHGEHAWLLPQVAPGTTGARAYSKWFGRFIGARGVTDEAKVFHSFRHGFTDALRVAGVGEDVIRALVGHTQGGVLGRYGAKDKAARYRHRLAEAVASVAYAGLDLSHLKGPHGRKGHQ